MILGTAAYMSPEQARGKTVDKRADIWAFGVLLYEMLTGGRLFTGETVSDVLAAVLTREPEWAALAAAAPVARPRAAPPLPRAHPETAPARRRRRAPSDRGRAGRQGGRPPGGAVGARAPPGGGAPSSGDPARARRRGGARRSPRPGRPARREAGHLRAPDLPPRALRQCPLRSRRPDGLLQRYVGRASTPGLPVAPARRRAQLGLRGVNLLSVSREGELALLLPRLLAVPYFQTGTLAVVSASGGTPRQLADDVINADWAPDGQTLAVIRDLGSLQRLEFPLGERRYEASGPLASLASPRTASASRSSNGRGRAVARDRGPQRKAQRAVARVVGLVEPGLDPGAAGRSGSAPRARALLVYAVDLEGRVRDRSAPGTLEIHDIAADGRALVARVATRTHVFGRARGTERKLSWLESTTVADLSADGRRLLLRENSEREGGRSGVFLRDMEGAPPVRLGEGLAEQLSPDGKVGARAARQPGGGTAHRPRHAALARHGARLARRRPLDAGRPRAPARGPRAGRLHALYSLHLEDGAPPRPIGDEFDLRLRPLPGRACPSPSRTTASAASRRSRSPPAVCASSPWTGRRLATSPAPGPTHGRSSGPRTAEVSTCSSTRRRSPPASSWWTSSGRRQLVHEIQARDSSGVYTIENVALTPDGAAYAYDYQQFQSDLYVVEGLR